MEKDNISKMKEKNEIYNYTNEDVELIRSHDPSLFNEMKEEGLLNKDLLHIKNKDTNNRHLESFFLENDLTDMYGQPKITNNKSETRLVWKNIKLFSYTLQEEFKEDIDFTKYIGLKDPSEIKYQKLEIVHGKKESERDMYTLTAKISEDSWSSLNNIVKLLSKEGFEISTNGMKLNQKDKTFVSTSNESFMNCVFKIHLVFLKINKVNLDIASPMKDLKKTFSIKYRSLMLLGSQTLITTLFNMEFGQYGIANHLKI